MPEKRKPGKQRGTFLIISFDSLYPTNYPVTFPIAQLNIFPSLLAFLNWVYATRHSDTTN